MYRHELLNIPHTCAFHYLNKNNTKILFTKNNYIVTVPRKEAQVVLEWFAVYTSAPRGVAKILHFPFNFMLFFLAISITLFNAMSCSLSSKPAGISSKKTYTIDTEPKISELFSEKLLASKLFPLEPSEIGFCPEVY